MLPRERWEAVLAGERPDRIPCDYEGTPEVTKRLLHELDCSTTRELWERLGIDRIAWLRPKITIPDPDRPSLWGIGYEQIDYGPGVYHEAVAHPLAHCETGADVDRFDWPDPSWWDVAGFRAQCEEWDGYPILLNSYEVFYIYCWMRGRERALEDLILNPAVVEAGMEHLFFLHESFTRGSLEAAGDLIHCVHVGEDLGGQTSLMISPEHFRRYMKDYMARLMDLAHSHGAKVYHHNDGAIRALIPELIDMGTDILNPVQWRCTGMDRQGLVDDFGDELIFHGAVDNQQTLPFGSPEDVRREVAENIEIFGKAKGYIVAPCNIVQPNTPTENIVAMYEAVEEYGQLA
jgi:uroporphyrinogen decarboxylase